jgi:hypothetical protein
MRRSTACVTAAQALAAAPECEALVAAQEFQDMVAALIIQARAEDSVPQVSPLQA